MIEDASLDPEPNEAEGGTTRVGTSTDPNLFLPTAGRDDVSTGGAEGRLQSGAGVSFFTETPRVGVEGPWDVPGCLWERKGRYRKRGT